MLGHMRVLSAISTTKQKNTYSDIINIVTLMLSHMSVRHVTNVFPEGRTCRNMVLFIVRKDPTHVNCVRKALNQRGTSGYMNTFTRVKSFTVVKYVKDVSYLDLN